MNVALVVNPFATHVTEPKLVEVRRELTRVADVEVLLTERRGHAVDLVRNAGGADALVVFSGDGVFNEALNGLHRDVPIGFLPGGGTSVFPRALGLPPEPVAAARRLASSIAERRTRRITLGRVNGRRFAFAAGVGLDAEAVRRVDRLGRSEDGRRPGDLAFALAVIRSLAARRGRIDPALDVKGFGRAAFALVANGSPYTYAKRVPLPIAPEAQFELGLDLVAPVRVRRSTLVPTAIAILSGHAGDRGRALYGHDLDRLEIVCDAPTALHADGEDLGDVTEAVFRAERGAVEVFI
jgi:diacylglycerol kinase family enzyme